MKPTYIKEIEERLGLECLLEPQSVQTQMPTYWVMSPTGVALFEVGSSQEDIIGMCTQPDMFKLQGISSPERGKRRLNLKNRKEFVDEGLNP